MSFSSIFFNGDEYNQMWINNYLVWQKVDDGDVPLPSDDAYPTYDLVISYEGTNSSYSDAYYTDTFPNKLDDSLEYIDSFSYWAWEGRDVSGTAKLKNVKFYGKTTTKTSGLGYFTLSYTLLKVSAPSSATDLSYLCYRISDETDIRFIRTKNATNMSHMFYQAKSTSLDLSAFRTSNVTTMDNMFYDCMYLTDLNISSFDTSNVEDMSYMFYYCSKLTSLNLSHFNTENVTDMNNMFYVCNGLTDLKLTNFNTSKVTNMSNMFNGCSKLKTLDLTSFDTSSVVNYEDMFLNVSDCTIYISGDWTLGTDATFGGGTNLNFVLINPITSITLESTLTDTSIIKGTTFTITPIAIPTNHTDEIVVTYDSNYLSKDGDTFTVLDTATVGQELAITYSSKYDSSTNTVYTVTIREAIPITSIALTHTLETLVDVEVGTTFVVEPTILPTTHDDELLIDYDTNYLSMTNNQFKVLKGASLRTVQIIYYSKLDNSVNAILEFTVKEFEGAMQPLDVWKADLVPLEWDSLYTNYVAANAKVTYNLEERSAKISVTARYNSYASICLKIGDNYTSIFDSTKYYKLSYKVRGKDTNGYSSYSSYSSQIYDGSTYTKYTNADNLLDETEWREENYVVYGITRFDVRCTYGESKNWIEIKDVMYQVYDEAPALPDIPIYQVASNEFSLVNMYKDGLATASSTYNTITVDDVNDYFTIKVKTNAKVKYMSASVSLPIGRFYTISGLGACYVSTGSNPMLWSLYNYDSDRYSLKNVGALITASNPDIATTENMKEVYMEEDKTNIDYLKNIYSRSLNGVFVRYIGFWLDSNLTTSYFIKFANLTIKEQE